MGNSEQVLQANPLLNYLSHKEEIDKAVSKVLSSGWYILGNEVSLFEQEFANYVGVKYGAGVGSGTEALHVALLSCGVSSGDEVITVSHTAVATVSAIELCGAKPVFVDINPQSYTMEPSKIASVITSHTKAIIPVHLYGHPVDIGPILEIAKQHGLMVIEDCAQAHGAIYKDKKVGSWGDIAAFSFYPTKNLGALGDGGIVVTNNPNLYDRAKLIRQYGWKERYISDISGMNSRLDELQASVLRVKLKYLEMENEKRREIARMYDNTLNKSILRIPSESKDVKHVYHLYVVRSTKRNVLRDFLNKRNIGTAVHYPLPVHLQPAYRKRINNSINLLNTEKVCTEILSLPIYPELPLDKVEYISDSINQWVSLNG